MLQTLKQLRSKRAQAAGPAAPAAASATPATTSSAVARDLEACNAKLRQLVLNDRGTWILSERFDARAAVWTVDLLRGTWDGVWRWQRYRYDRENDVLYFWGEQSIDEQALRSFRRPMDERFWPQVAASTTGSPRHQQPALSRQNRRQEPARRGSLQHEAPAAA